MTHRTGNDSPARPPGEARHLTPADLSTLGLGVFAYICRVVDDEGQEAWAVHAADGSPMGVMADRDVAFAAVLQHDLQPLSVH